MTALLTADEAARLVPGEQLVIVRAGDQRRTLDVIDRPNTSWKYVYDAPQDWVALTGPCPTCDGSMIVGDPEQCHECGAVPCNRHRCPDCRDGRRIVPLYTECPWCHGTNRDPVYSRLFPEFVNDLSCPSHTPEMNVTPCEDGRVLVSRGSIEVVPVVDATDDDADHGQQHLCLCDGVLFYGHGKDYLEMVPDPLPVPDRDFGIVIDCVEVAA